MPIDAALEQSYPCFSYIDGESGANMKVARLCAAVAAVALGVVLLLPGSANAGWHGRTHPHWIRIYPVLDRIYPPQRWGHPGVDLGWSYPMYGEYVRGPNYFHRVYYYQMPPYYDCCW